MTRQKSDAQLDAEAAAPRVEQPIEELIEDHRHLYRADLAQYQLHVSSGETETEDTGARPKTNGHPATWTGLPYSHPFLRFINWSRKDVEEGVRPSFPGQRFAWSAAFTAQWAECRRYHPEHHGRPEWRGSLCRQLVSLTVRSDPALSIESACLVLGVTPPRAGRTLRNALLFIEAHIDRGRKRQEERARHPRERMGKTPDGERLWRESDEMQKHGQLGLHADDCPQCRVAS